jgi:uncharacterized protein (DUF111 family)
LGSKVELAQSHSLKCGTSVDDRSPTLLAYLFEKLQQDQILDHAGTNGVQKMSS